MTLLNLLLQLMLPSPWLWLIADGDQLPTLVRTDLVPALVVVGVPLVMAAATERWVEARPNSDAVREHLA